MRNPIESTRCYFLTSIVHHIFVITRVQRYKFLSNQQNFTEIYLCAILIPPIYRIIKRHDSLLDKVGILGCELFWVVASDDTEEG